MSRTTVDFGIDLGTTNSAIAVRAIDEVHVIPSVVHMTSEGKLEVGEAAKEAAVLDPDNTFSEFKRLMGTTTKLDFASIKISKTPEELSAEVLRALCDWMKTTHGQTVDMAVITVPALFEIPQNEATQRAAALAGISHAPLLQEPIAAALAYGFGQKQEKQAFWLVYDFGGGTFDASLVSIRDGRLSVVDHDGDNFLGGKDLDKRVLDLMLGKLKNRYTLPALEADHKSHGNILATLKNEAENLRIKLSDNPKTTLSIPNFARDDTDHLTDVEITVSREELDRVIMPEISRSIDICERVLDRNRLNPEDVGRLVLVGGVTRTPLIRRLLTERLAIELECDLDPATTVAQGAAIHAASIRRPQKTKKPNGSLSLQLEYPSVSQDLSPYVVGRFLEDDNTRPERVEILKQDSKWTSGKLKITEQGAFMCQIDLTDGETATFALKAYSEDETELPIEPDSFQITHGLAVSAPPLSRSLGIGLADNSVNIFMSKGTSLPSQSSDLLRTTTALEPGHPGAVIDVPVVQGESDRADRNRHIGTLCIPATRIRRALPSNSEVQITVEVDGSSIVKAKAYVPFLDQVFEQVLSTRLVPSGPEELEADLELAFRRRAKLEESREGTVIVGELGDAPFDEIIRDIASSSLGDQDSALRAQRRLLELHELLDKAESDVRWPKLVSKAHWAKVATNGVVEEHGEMADRELFEGLEKELSMSITARDIRAVERKTRSLWRLHHRVLARKPDYWIDLFWRFAQRKEAMTDQNQAEKLIERGKGAIKKHDYRSLENIVLDMDALFPPEDEERPLGLRSHVR